MDYITLPEHEFIRGLREPKGARIMPSDWSPEENQLHFRIEVQRPRPHATVFSQPDQIIPEKAGHLMTKSFPGIRPPERLLVLPKIRISGWSGHVSGEVERELLGPLMQFLKKHGSIFVKNAEGGGGVMTVRLRQIGRHLEVTHPIMESDKIELKKEELNLPLSSTDSIKLASFLARRCGWHWGLDRQTPIILQKEIEQVRIGDNPIEVRFRVQREKDHYVVLHHYAKIGSNPLVANTTLFGGTMGNTKEILLRGFKQAYPGKRASEYRDMIGAFLEKAKKMALQVMKKVPEYGMDPAILKTNEGHILWVPPLISNVDFVVHPVGNHPEPVIMEHHAVDTSQMQYDADKGIITKKTWATFVRRHGENIAYWYNWAKGKIKDNHTK